jgi:hypothetical protein
VILSHSKKDSRKYAAILMKSIRKEATTIRRMNMQARQLPVKMAFNSTSAAQNLGAMTAMETQS